MACARLPEGGSVEGVGCGGLGGELNHLMQAGFVGLPPLRVVPLHETGLLSVVSAGSDKGFKEAGEGHGLLFSVVQWAQPHPGAIDSTVPFPLRRLTWKTGEIRKEVHCLMAALEINVRT